MSERWGWINGGAANGDAERSKIIFHDFVDKWKEAEERGRKTDKEGIIKKKLFKNKDGRWLRKYKKKERKARNKKREGNKKRENKTDRKGKKL